MKRKKFIILPLILALVLLISGCETVIDVDLNESDAKLVVEATLTDQPGSARVLLTRSTSYFEVEAVPRVSDATVTISDDQGQVFTLEEEQPGEYRNDSLQGVAGRSYTLNIATTQETVTGTAYLPPPINIDSMVPQLVSGPMSGGEGLYLIRCHYRDPAGIQNFYRPILQLNGTTTTDVFAFDDSNNDGIPTAVPVFSDAIQAGDSVTVLLWTIDRSNFYFYNAFSQNPGSEQGGGAAPGNPETNLSGDVLGIFTAASQSAASIVIAE